MSGDLSESVCVRGTRGWRGSCDHTCSASVEAAGLGRGAGDDSERKWERSHGQAPGNRSCRCSGLVDEDSPSDMGSDWPSGSWSETGRLKRECPAWR